MSKVCSMAEAIARFVPSGAAAANNRDALISVFSAAWRPTATPRWD